MDRGRKLGALLVWSFASTLAVSLSVASGSAVASGSPPEEAKCVRHAGQFQEGPSVSPKIVLTPDVATETINFGGGRGWQFADVVLRASQVLPASFTPAQLDIQVLRRFSRQGDTLSTVAIEPPLFTEPQINPRRNAITFTICLNGAKLGAGHYAGAITVEGPAGIESTNVALNVNAQNSTMFWWTAGVTGILVLFLLFWRGATTVQSEAAKDAAGHVQAADVEAKADAAAAGRANPTAAAGGAATLEVPAAAATAASKALQTSARWSLRKDVITDPLFLVSTILSAGAAVAAAWAIYSANTGWGSDPVTDIFAVVAGILSAAGLRSLIATAAGK